MAARLEVAERLADQLDRVDDLAVPVAVEDRRQLLHRRAHHERVHVDEVRRLRAQEVLVGDVAPADHRHHPVGDEQLVVHAVVEAAEVEQRRDVAAATPPPRAQQNGLKRWTSTFGKAARPRNSASVWVV
jgi:hypothetical protein